MDFSLIAAASLTQREFSELCGVSRVTTNLWVTGKMRPHRYIQANIASVLDAIKAALDANELPLSNKVDRSRRSQELRSIIERTIPQQPAQA